MSTSRFALHHYMCDSVAAENGMPRVHEHVEGLPHTAVSAEHLDHLLLTGGECRCGSQLQT